MRWLKILNRKVKRRTQSKKEKHLVKLYIWTFSCDWSRLVISDWKLIYYLYLLLKMLSYDVGHICRSNIFPIQRPNEERITIRIFIYYYWIDKVLVRRSISLINVLTLFTTSKHYSHQKSFNLIAFHIFIFSFLLKNREKVSADEQVSVKRNFNWMSTINHGFSDLRKCNEVNKANEMLTMNYLWDYNVQII